MYVFAHSIFAGIFLKSSLILQRNEIVDAELRMSTFCHIIHNIVTGLWTVF